MKKFIVTPDRVVNIKEVRSLRGIDADSEGVTIGAVTNLDDILESPHLNEFPSVQQAIRNMSSPQLQAQGTIGGDLCQRPRCWFYRNGYGRLSARELDHLGDNRFHAIFGNEGAAKFVSASRLAPALIALGAEVRVIGPGSQDELFLPLASLFQTPRTEWQRETVLEPNQLLTHIRIPRQGVANARMKCGMAKVPTIRSWLLRQRCGSSRHRATGGDRARPSRADAVVLGRCCACDRRSSGDGSHSRRGREAAIVRPRRSRQRVQGATGQGRRQTCDPLGRWSRDRRILTMSEGLNVIGQPMCRHLLSKGMFVSGTLNPSQDDGHMSDGYCWCNQTQGQRVPTVALSTAPSATLREPVSPAGSCSVPRSTTRRRCENIDCNPTPLRVKPERGFR